jgi:hypothetical protein
MTYLVSGPVPFLPAGKKSGSPDTYRRQPPPAEKGGPHEPDGVFLWLR